MRQSIDFLVTESFRWPGGDTIVDSSLGQWTCSKITVVGALTLSYRLSQSCLTFRRIDEVIGRGKIVVAVGRRIILFIIWTCIYSRKPRLSLCRWLQWMGDERPAGWMITIITECWSVSQWIVAGIKVEKQKFSGSMRKLISSAEIVR